MNSDQVKSVFDQCKIKAGQVEISNFKIGLTSSLLLGSNLEKIYILICMYGGTEVCLSFTKMVQALTLADVWKVKRIKFFNGMLLLLLIFIYLFFIF